MFFNLCALRVSAPIFVFLPTRAIGRLPALYGFQAGSNRSHASWTAYAC